MKNSQSSEPQLVDGVPMNAEHVVVENKPEVDGADKLFAGTESQSRDEQGAPDEIGSFDNDRQLVLSESKLFKLGVLRAAGFHMNDSTVV